MVQKVLARWRVRTGYAVAILYFLLASPTPRSILLGAAIAILGLLVRGLAAGHLRKQNEVTISGPYLWTRNPLYFGSAVLTAGFAVAGNSIWSAILVCGYYVAFYPAAMRREEEELRTHFAPEFAEFRERVPLFWPRPPRRGALPEGCTPREFSWAQYKRNREYQAALGFLVALALLWLRMEIRGYR